MYPHAKVMTVSYGTFSCSLDGFDDPLTTMQLVAKYFRKLSADDRYFDTEVSDNSVILRLADVVDVPSKVQSIDTDAPAWEDTETLEEAVSQNDGVFEMQATPAEEIVDETYENKASLSSRRAAASALDTTIAKEGVTPVVSPEEKTVVVSAAVQALKSDEAIDRWLETANEKMAMPEHVSKVNALELLKAAVAATEAERATLIDKIHPMRLLKLAKNAATTQLLSVASRLKYAKLTSGKRVFFYGPNTQPMARECMASGYKNCGF
jgi:hypothetical protein